MRYFLEKDFSKFFMKNEYPHAYSRRAFLKTGAAAFAGGSLLPVSSRSAPAAQTSSRPNLLFVFTDQHSWDMLGCYGNSQIRTPHLDRFAAQGVRFNHCVSTSPVCSPYRGSLLTGQYPLKHGVVRNNHDLLCPPGDSFGERLSDAGYNMGYVGKWHLLGGETRPIPMESRFGFGEEFYSNGVHVDFRPGKCYYFHPETGKKIFFHEWEQTGQASQAMSFLDQQDGEDPFALFLSWHPPHNHVGLNYFAPESYEKLYPKDEIRLRPDARDQQGTKLVEEYQGHMGLISHVDDLFGQLMAKLEERGLAENTIVVFTADHGDMMRYKEGTSPDEMGGDWRQRYFKSHPLPTACRVPFLIRWPEKLRPGVSDLLLGSMDLMPTLLGLMEIPAPRGMDGRDSSADILNHNADAVNAIPLAVFSGRGFRGVYTREHVYAFDLRGLRPGEEPAYQYLVNHREDPYGLDNHYDDPNFRRLQDQLDEQTRTLMAGLGDEGWSYGQICRATLEDPEEAAGHLAAQGKRMRNKGRPLDLLRESGFKGRFS